MSHFVAVKTQLRDMDAVHAACRELGLQLMPNTIARGYRGATREFAFVIKCSGAYDVGLEKQPDGTYQITADWYTGDGGTVAQQIGEKGRKLIQLYGVHKATQEAQRRGLRVERVLKSNGAITLRMTGGRL